MPAKPQSADKEKPEAKPGREGKKILIVEDERPLAHALELKFQHEGFDTTVCVNGKDALEEALKNKYDMILLDLIMPAKDGFQALKELKADPELKDIKVVVLSNLGQEEDKRRAMEAGALGYIVKANVSFREIINQVRRHLGIAQA